MSRDKKEEASVEFDGAICKRETEKALLVEIEGEEHWMPKSQLAEGNELTKEGDEGTLIVTEWIAKEKGLL